MPSDQITVKVVLQSFLTALLTPRSLLGSFSSSTAAHLRWGKRHLPPTCAQTAPLFKVIVFHLMTTKATLTWTFFGVDRSSKEFDMSRPILKLDSSCPCLFIAGCFLNWCLMYCFQKWIPIQNNSKGLPSVYHFKVHVEDFTILILLAFLLFRSNICPSLIKGVLYVKS